MSRYYVWAIPMVLACSRGDAMTPRRFAGEMAALVRSVGLDDAAILAALDQVNGAEIAAAALATTQTTTGVIKAMAKRIQDDHTRSREKIQALAAKLSIRMAPAGADQAELGALRSKRGADFDRAFVEHEIAMHQQAIDKITTNLIPAATSPDVKALLDAAVPVLQAHLDLARAAQDQLQKP